MMKHVFHHWHVIVFVLIIGVAAYFVCINLGYTRLYVDEIAIGVDAKSILETGKDMHGGSWFPQHFHLMTLNYLSIYG